MKLTLMHNSNSGDQTHSVSELIAELKRAGHKVASQSTKAKDFAKALDDPGELVVIAGGDGTVRKVALRLIDRDVPIAILSFGTANNIARALGFHMDPFEVIRSLPTARRIAVDVGMARGPWGSMPFIEGAGLGFFPRLMSTRAWNKKHGVTDAVDRSEDVDGGRHLGWHVLDRLHGCEFELMLDGELISGSSLLLEIMNIPSIGPVLEIAPGADPGDGRLDVVLVMSEERPRLERYLRAVIERKYKRPRLSVRRARQIHLLCSTTELHFDDECWPRTSSRKTPAKVQLRSIETLFETLPGALSALIPKPASRRAPGRRRPRGESPR
jgi:diacylglycerol kinase (ATP)